MDQPLPNQTPEPRHTHAPAGPLEHFHYDNKIVWMFLVATIIFGVVGLGMGLFVALQLIFPDLNFDLPYTSFGRLRPLHTNAAIFAFVGNAIFAGVYYSMQRLLKARMFSDVLSRIHFWGWQLIILSAAITLPLGITSSKEYAELEWPIDIAIALIWVVFGINMVGTILRRRVRHMYVAIWFYLATFLTVAVLHIVNSFEMPVSFLKSYSAFSGVQDALVQWWYGHNAVAFFLTTPFLGLMYYYLPKAANRPVYSYRLSIIHFWSLIFIYIWAGPHHLLYSSLPTWAQTLGTVFSIMLIAPSWGGMLNGLLTLRGAWDRVRQDAILKFFVVAVTCYGMATLEGPLLSLKNVNAIAHFTDWIPAHVHIGTLGWNGFMVFGMIYWMVPRMFGTTLWSQKLANTHFWLGVLGIVFYAIPMYFSGFTQGLMWDEITPDGNLAYKFLATTLQLLPMHYLRAIGGSIYVFGLFILAYNIWKTVAQGRLVKNEADSHPALDNNYPDGKYAWHRVLERKPLVFVGLSVVAVLIGGIVEIMPSILVSSTVTPIATVQPYTPLELEGRDIYIREGCVGCHTQWVRPFRSEVLRYGAISQGGEFVYDHPFLWGSKRTGPDLHRAGLRYRDSWHYRHMLDPTLTSPESIMPRYGWLHETELDVSLLKSKILALTQLGVPYPEGYAERAEADLWAQARTIQANLLTDSIQTSERTEIVAMIAYLQRLGKDLQRNDSLRAAGIDPATWVPAPAAPVSSN